MHVHVTTKCPSGRTYEHDDFGNLDDVVSFEVTVRGEPTTITMPMRDVMRLAANTVRAQRIVELENTRDEVMLGLER